LKKTLEKNAYWRYYMKRWSVVDMPEETIAAIKNRALEYRCSIPEILAQEFGGEAKFKSDKVWKVYNVSEKVQKELSSRAKKCKKSISYILEDLLFNYKESEAEMEARLQRKLVDEVREYLKKFRKIT
jgi:hypothetical protein